jgi:hypothetical protein
MTNFARRITAAAVLAAAPALIALGTATGAQADTTATNSGPSVSQPAPGHPYILNGPDTTPHSPYCHRTRRHRHCHSN